MKHLNSLKNKFKNTESLFASGGLTFLFRIAGLGLNFLVTLVITRIYGDAVYGSYSLAFTLSQAIGLVFALGFPNALVSYLGMKPAHHPDSQYFLKRSFTILACLSLLPMTALYFGADYIAATLFNNPGLAVYISVAAFTVPAMVLHELLLYFFIATGNFKRFNIFMFIVPNILLLALLLIVTHVPAHYTFLFYFLSVFLTFFTEAFFAFNLKVARPETSISPRQMFSVTLPMMFSGLMLYLLNWTDVFMLGANVGEEELGHYNLAYKIASLATLVIISMNVVIAPRISALHKEGNIAAMHKTVRKTTYLIIALTATIVVVLILLSGYILNFFGPGFIAGQQALIIISVGLLLNSATGNVDQILNMTGNQRALFYTTLSGFICNVILNTLLIPRYGINGAAIASLVTNVFFNFTCVIIIKKRLGFYTFA
ncbi:flippase [Flavobacterium rhizosphaerae]|uniref:Flippase n=1 Tax=Flavobacterium rhizosphaerae TaxID=3163298 RepID=A0ABW8YY33_9FLAO